MALNGLARRRDEVADDNVRPVVERPSGVDIGEPPMITDCVGITLPKVAPMPACTSGMAATCG